MASAWSHSFLPLEPVDHCAVGHWGRSKAPANSQHCFASRVSEGSTLEVDVRSQLSLRWLQAQLTSSW